MMTETVIDRLVPDKLPTDPPTTTSSSTVCVKRSLLVQWRKLIAFDLAHFANMQRNMRRHSRSLTFQSSCKSGIYYRCVTEIGDFNYYNYVFNYWLIFLKVLIFLKFSFYLSINYQHSFYFPSSSSSSFSKKLHLNWKQNSFRTLLPITTVSLSTPNWHSRQMITWSTRRPSKTRLGHWCDRLFN